MQKIIIGKKIAYYRKLRDITQNELAKEIGVSAQAVSKWEQELTCPDVMLIPKMAEIFRVSIDELFGVTPQKEIIYSASMNMPWKDDGRIRVAMFNGTKMVSQSEYKCLEGENKFYFEFDGPEEIKGVCKFVCKKLDK